MSNDFGFHTCVIMLYCSIEQEINLRGGKMEFKELMEKVAKKHGTTAMEVYSEIQKVIDVGMKDPDEEVQKNWKRIPYEGEKPSPEELIQYLVSEILCMEEETCEEVQ